MRQPNMTATEVLRRQKAWRDRWVEFFEKRPGMLVALTKYLLNIIEKEETSQ